MHVTTIPHTTCGQTIHLQRIAPSRVRAHHRARAQTFAIRNGIGAWRAAEQVARWRCDEPSSEDVAALARQLHRAACRP